MNKQRFPYSTSEVPLRNLPFLPITLLYRGYSCSVSALVDTGASVNVLPYELGLQLGAILERQPKSAELVGNLANYEARGLLVLMDRWTRMSLSNWCLDTNARCSCHFGANEFLFGV